MKSERLAFFTRLIVAASLVLGSLPFWPAYAPPVIAAYHPGDVAFGGTLAAGVPASLTESVKRGMLVTQCDSAYTKISAIQGSVDTPALSGSITTQGFVTAKMGDAKGYYIQSAVEDQDSDELTSEGLYIFSANSTVVVGDYVRLTGTLAEYQRVTEMDATTYLEKCPPTGKTEPGFMDLDLTLVNSAEYLERYENMLVNITGMLTVQQNYFQGRYGQVTLGAGGRIFGKTNGGGATGYYQMIVLDDWSSAQNKNPIPYYLADGALRAGDTVEGVKGVLNQGAINSTTTPAVFPYNWYRLQPTTAPVFTTANARPLTPPAVGGTLKVAAFNVENYFTTLDVPPYTFPYINGNTPRGADSAAEFDRQKTKIIAGIKAIDADVVGLIEVESYNAAGALEDLVNSLNASTGSNVYAAVADSVPDPDGTAGGYDFIQVAIIYKPGSVTPVGSAKIDNQPVYDRVPVAQTFQSVANGEKFSVVVNHFKSKGSCPTAAGDPQNIDLGQGCWNAKRTQQAQQLLTFIDTELKPVDPDVLVIGDLNSYSEEDPIKTLAEGGLVDQPKALIGFSERYSYVFDGAAGYLDTILTTQSMIAQVTGAAFWHINSDEPSVIDFNTEFKNYGAVTSYSPDLYQPHVFRSSDHDPVYIGLNLANQAPQVAQPLVDQVATQNVEFIYTFGAGAFVDVEPGALTYNAALADGSPLPAWLSFDAATRTFSGKPVSGDAGVMIIRVTATDGGSPAASVSDDFTLTVKVLLFHPFIGFIP